MRKSAEKQKAATETTHHEEPGDDTHNEDYRKAVRRRWVALIKKVYELDPLICPKCGGAMKIIAFIMEAAVIRKILEHIGEYAPPERAPPNARSPTQPDPTPSAVASGEWEYFPEEPIP